MIYLMMIFYYGLCAISPRTVCACVWVLREIGVMPLRPWLTLVTLIAIVDRINRLFQQIIIETEGSRKGDDSLPDCSSLFVNVTCPSLQFASICTFSRSYFLLCAASTLYTNLFFSIKHTRLFGTSCFYGIKQR